MWAKKLPQQAGPIWVNSLWDLLIIVFCCRVTAQNPRGVVNYSRFDFGYLVSPSPTTTKGNNTMNPLDSILGTIITGFVLAIVIAVIL
jgi:hypothetical protein